MYSATAKKIPYYEMVSTKIQRTKKIYAHILKMAVTPKAVIYFNSIGYSIIFVSRPGTETYSFFIQTLHNR